MANHEFKNMIGRAMTQVVGKVGDEEMVFHAYDGSEFRFFHTSDCCESVAIEDIAGDISDLIGSPILAAEAVDSPDPEGFDASDHESFTWTFYKFRTQKGDVTVRWFGSYTGYYSESVDFAETLAARAE